MRGQRLIFAVLTSVTACAAGAITFAQPGRGGSQWLTALADAQRTSWVRTDDKISLAALSKPGFEQQWRVKLANQARGAHGLAQGVTASGVTLFVPMSIVAGSSNNVFGIDNDIGHVVWQRRFDAALPAATAGCAGGITSAATRIVKLDSPTAASASGFGGGRGRGVVGYRSLLGEPGEGVPAEGRAAGPPAGRGAPAGVEQGAARGAAPGARGAAPAPSAAAAVDRIPGSPRGDENASPFAFLFRPSGVGYVVSSDGMLHVLGLASGKDLQRPAAFLPANSKWSAPVAVDTMLYAATSGKCGGAPARRVGDRSGQRPEACRVVEDERRRGRGGRRLHAGRHTHRRNRFGSGNRGREGERDRRARPQDAQDQGLVLAADGGVRHRPDRHSSQQPEHRCSGNQGRTRPPA